MAWAPSYVTPTQLKAFAAISVSDHDAWLDLAIAAASRAVDQFCNRQFGLVDAPEERSYTAEWDRRQCRWVVWHDDVMAPVTGFSIETESGVIDAYALKPANAVAQGRPYTHTIVDPASTYTPTGARDEVTITARWGWASVPDAVQEATLLQANRLFKRHDAPFGVAGSPQLGSELRLLAKVDPDVAVVLTPYVRWWAAA